MAAKLIEPTLAHRVLAEMEINPPNDAALLAALVRNSIAEHTEAGVISTAAILAVVMPQVPNGFSRDDVIALIVRETGTGYAISFDHEDDKLI